MPPFQYKPLDIRLRILDLAVKTDTYESVLSALGAGIRAAGERIESVGGEVVDYETEVIENMLGVAYVTCQPQISAVVRAVKHFPDQGVSVRGLHKLGPRFDEKYSKVEVLWELANYFKHRDQWSRKTWANPPDDRTNRTATAIKAAGLSYGSGDNLRKGAEALGNAAPYADVAGFHRIVRCWSGHVREHIRARPGH